VASLAAKQQTGVYPLFRYITANVPSMARLRYAARAIFGLPDICKYEGLLDCDIEQRLLSEVTQLSIDTECIAIARQ